MTAQVHRLPRAAEAAPRIRPQSRRILLAVELRKAVDTRPARLLIVVTLLASLVVLGYDLAHVTDQAVFSDMVQGSVAPLTVFLPALAVLAMTSEWSQRTALVTFALSPWRSRVLICKAGAALLIGAAVTAIVVVLTALAALLAGLAAGHLSFAHAESGAGAAFASVGIDVLMGVAFGALITSTPAALVAYYVVPTVWGGVLTSAGGWSAWVNVTDAVARISHLKPGGFSAETFTAVTIWVLAPAAAGLVVGARRAP